MRNPGGAEREFRELLTTGVQVIPGAFDADTVEEARQVVLAHTDLMKRTRPTPSSRHLAGFHRYPELEPLHDLLTDNPVIAGCLHQLLGDRLRTIGLSDITVDRSQQWHKDLLRGPYRTFLDHAGVCATDHGKAYKVILYLQDSNSLQVIPGSHLRDIDLGGDEHAIPGPDDAVTSVAVRRGDAVIIDLCTTHRGADESAYAGRPADAAPKILISTVFTAADCRFADQLESGNAARLADWDRRPAEPAASPTGR